MKYLITESQYNTLMEQQISYVPISKILNTNPIFDDVVKRNKKYLGLAVNSQITPEYTKKMNDALAKKNVDASQRTLLGSLIGLIPVYEQAADFESIVGGILTKNLSELNSGILGLMIPVSYKAVTGLMDYVDEKLNGKGNADYNQKKRDDIVNMSQHEKEALFKRYGMGGYDKWVKAGKPKL